MSLGIVKKNSSSPFHLQRSIVDQGGEGGAYESGGYNPENVYNDNGISESIMGFGKVLAAGISSITAEDQNNSNIAKKARLEKRQGKIIDKMNIDSNSDSRQNALSKRFDRVEKRKEKTSAEIKAYDETYKPTTKSSINKKELLGHI